MDGDQTIVTPFTVTLGGKVLPTGGADTHVHSLSVDQDLRRPDICTVVVNCAESGATESVPDYSNTVSIGKDGEPTPLVVKIHDTVVFDGEVVGLEPTFESRGATRCIIRAFNGMHRLLRGRVSRTYPDARDSDVARTIAGKNGLRSGMVEDTDAVHEHLYQHNQTELEFLLHRAGACGFEVKVEGKDLIFRKPKKERKTNILLELKNPDPKAYRLKRFSPRLSTAGIVNAVEVRGWDPVKKEAIVHRQDSLPSELGLRTGPEVAAAAFGDVVTYDVDSPCFDLSVAKERAKALMQDCMMSYIVGDGEVVGTPDLHAGMVVNIKVSETVDHRFNGYYLLEGVSHRYGRKGGYDTAIRVRRDAEGGKGFSG